MKVSGSALLHGSREQVWAAVTDPAVLATVIPGCDALTPVADHRFALTVTLGVASIKGSYSGEVAFSNLREPETLTMRANGSGGPGTIDTTVQVGFTELPDGTTRVDYDADAMVGGMVGGVGQRVLAGVAKKTAGLFFAAIDDVLTGTLVVEPATAANAAAVPAQTGPGGPATTGAAVPAAPAPFAAAQPAGARQNAVSLLGAAAFGALSMLAGVLVGARIARRR
jgi:hypothetical protein